MRGGGCDEAEGRRRHTEPPEGTRCPARIRQQALRSGVMPDQRACLHSAMAVVRGSNGRKMAWKRPSAQRFHWSEGLSEVPRQDSNPCTRPRGGGALGPAASSLATCSWLPIETHQPLRPEVSAGLSVLHLCPDPGQPRMGVNSHPPSRSAAHPRPEGIAVARYDFIGINRRFYAIQGNSMPLFTVTMRSGRTVAEKDAISAAIHEASVSAGYPEGDHFQRFISLEEADLRISPRYPDLRKPRSEHVLMIEAVLSSGTGEQRKRSLLSAIVARLQAAGMDPNDIMVSFGEVDRAGSSFGGGRSALPVDLRPQKWSRARPPSIRRRPGKRAKTCELGSSPTSVGSARLHELPAAVPARCRRTRRSEDRAVRGPGRGDRRVSCDHP